MSKASPDAMSALHGAIALELMNRITSGEATAADMSNAIKFLKDNGIEADALSNPGVASLAKNFPTFSHDDDGGEHTIQ
jgi:hypothetical protein